MSALDHVVVRVHLGVSRSERVFIRYMIYFNLGKVVMRNLCKEEVVHHMSVGDVVHQLVYDAARRELVHMKRV